MRGETTRVEIRGKQLGGKRLGGKCLGGKTSCDHYNYIILSNEGDTVSIDRQITIPGLSTTVPVVYLDCYIYILKHIKHVMKPKCWIGPIERGQPPDMIKAVDRDVEQQIEHLFFF